MKINQNSWHFTVLQGCYAFTPFSQPRPQTLCTYFWSLVTAPLVPLIVWTFGLALAVVLACTFLGPYVGGVMWALGFDIWEKTSPWNLVGTFFTMGILVHAFLLLGFGLAWYFNQHNPWQSPLWIYLAERKRGLCPLIEYDAEPLEPNWLSRFMERVFGGPR